MDRKLMGRRILVTGAASGIGQGIARLFAEHGAALALFDRNWKDDDQVPEGAIKFDCDVANRASTNEAVAKAAEALGGLDGVVNAAGILDIAHFPELDPESWDRMLAVNLTGPFNVCKAALPWLQAAERATIVNLASVSAAMPMLGTSGYSASKAGLSMFTKCLAFDLGPNIRANAISPGTIRTPMNHFIFENPEHTQRAADRCAMKRVGEPEDIARAVLYFSCEDSAYSTGVDMLVDGGFSWR